MVALSMVVATWPSIVPVRKVASPTTLILSSSVLDAITWVRSQSAPVTETFSSSETVPMLPKDTPSCRGLRVM